MDASQAQKAASAVRSPLVEGALFLAVGGTATLANTVIFAGLVHLAGLNPAYSAALAFVFLVPAHFLSYARLVFPPNHLNVSLFVRYLMALALSFALNVGLVAFYWGMLGAEPLPAQVLGLIPAIVANFLSFKFFVFRSDRLVMPPRDAPALLFMIALATSVLAVYAAIAAMLLAVGPAVAETATDPLRGEGQWAAILTWREGHLMIVPNVITYLNNTFLGGAPSLLAILGAGLVGLSGLIAAFVVDRRFQETDAGPLQRLATAATVLASFLGLQLSTGHADPADLLPHQLVVLGASAAALISSGHVGRPAAPLSVAGFTVAGLIASMSFGTGALVWAFPVVLMILHRAGWRQTDAAQTFCWLLAGFSLLSDLLVQSAEAVAAYRATALAAIACAALVAVQDISLRRFGGPSGGRISVPIALLLISLTIAAMTYRVIAATHESSASAIFPSRWANTVLRTRSTSPMLAVLPNSRRLVTPCPEIPQGTIPEKCVRSGSTLMAMP